MAKKISEIATGARLEEFFGRIDRHLKDSRKRESFAMYACGILGDGERKSAEPIAARACPDPDEVRHVHDKLLHFLARSVWDDRAVRLEAARYAIEAISKREPITTWIVDDTGFLKQGSNSVGVQRQYTGSAGKITNCQIGVSLAIATGSEHLPLDFELYLPESWANDEAQRRQARIPDAVRFKTKIELALEMIERAVKQDVPGEIILADAAYGDSNEFRNTVRALGFDFAVGVQSSLRVVRLDSRDIVNEKPQTAAALVGRLGSKAFSTITWRDGSGGKLCSRFCFVRVKTAHDDGLDLSAREPLWLIAEWPDGEDAPTKFMLTTLARRMSKKQIIRICKQRWRTERMYQDLKGELGLDHFEGRSFPGWHHHISVVLCCFAFVVAERFGAFPPSAGRARAHHSLGVAA
jgi:SRSO17 transposase